MYFEHQLKFAHCMVLYFPKILILPAKSSFNWALTEEVHLVEKLLQTASDWAHSLCPFNCSSHLHFFQSNVWAPATCHDEILFRLAFSSLFFSTPCFGKPSPWGFTYSIIITLCYNTNIPIHITHVCCCPPKVITALIPFIV